MMVVLGVFLFFFSSRRRHTRLVSDWSSDVCSSDLEAGITRFIPNIPGHWEGVQVTAPMTDAVRSPVRLINDARAFALAEHGLGAGRGARAMLGITLGTGVGGGLILDGHLYLGHEGTAGEFGHQTILPDGPLCNCGNHGCLEALDRADAIYAAYYKLSGGSEDA